METIRHTGWRAHKGHNPDNLSGFRPQGNRVLLSIPQVETTTASGIILQTKTAEAEQGASVEAIVLEIGHDCWTDKNTDFCGIGDRVLVGKYTGKLHVSPVDGKTYRFVTDLDIICVFE